MLSVTYVGYVLDSPSFAVLESLSNLMAGLSSPAPCITDEMPFQNEASNLIAASRARGHALAWIRKVSLHLSSRALFRTAISLVADWARMRRISVET